MSVRLSLFCKILYFPEMNIVVHLSGTQVGEKHCVYCAYVYTHLCSFHTAVLSALGILSLHVN